MTSNSPGIAIFGAGRWGVHLVRNFLEHPQARVVAIADPHGDRLQRLKTQLGLDNSVLLTTNWKAAIDLPTVDAVAIATPATTHSALAEAALRQGHHVLIEKPLTLDGQDSIALCQLAEQRQRQLVVDHTYLFHPAIQTGKAILQEGGVGDRRYGYATRTHLGPVRQDVDALWDLAIHDIAIFSYWLGEFPVQVQAQGMVWLQATRTSSHFPQGLSDLVWVTLIYASGFQATLHLCWSNPDKQRRLCLVGNQGTLVFDELSPTPLILRKGSLESQEQTFLPTQLQDHTIPVEPAEPLRQVCDHFLQCVRYNIPSSISSGWLGAKFVKILLALSKSMQHNGEPIFLE